MYMTDLMSLKDLTQAIEDGFVKAQEDVYTGFLIYNYTARAMVLPGAWDNPAVRICRGLIVDPSNYGYRVVARPWEKFFGYGQAEAGDIDFSAPAEVSDKADGSCGIVYLSPQNEVRVATRGSFQSAQALWATEWIQQKTPISNPDVLRDTTYLVEIVYPQNRIVCVEGNTPLTLWDGTHMRMDEIVNHKKKVLLRGVDSDGSVVPTEILGWRDNGYGRDWVTIRTDSYIGSANAPTHISVTPDHQIKTTRGWVPARTVRAGDEVLSSFKKLNSDALHVIQSSLLGDGCLHGGKTTFFSEGHTSKNDYGKDSHRLMGNLANKLTGPINFDSFHTSPFEELAELRNRWYQDGVKIIPADLSWMDDFTMAKWIMDDGCLTKDGGVNIATHCFTYEEVERLGIWIYERYRVSCHIQKTPSGPLLRINKGRRGTYNDITALWEKVVPYFFKSMAYKVPKEFHPLVETASYPRPQWSLATKPVKVVAVDMQPRKRSGKKQYDLTTTTGNYFAKNLLVHNCDYDGYEGLILLGAVDIASGKYLGPQDPSLSWNQDRTEVFSASTLAEALALPPRAGAEGMCVRFLDTNKIVKIKQDDYLELHRLIFGINKRAIWELAYNDGNPSTPEAVDSFLEPLPDEFHSWIRRVWDEIWDRVGETQDTVVAAYSALSSEFDPKSKEFAMAVQERYTTYQKFLFSVRSGQNLAKVILKSIQKDYRGDETPLESIEE